MWLSDVEGRKIHIEQGNLYQLLLLVAAFMIHYLQKQKLSQSSHSELKGWLCARMFHITSQ